jgi:hypothetical protein
VDTAHNLSFLGILKQHPFSTGSLKFDAINLQSISPLLVGSPCKKNSNLVDLKKKMYQHNYVDELQISSSIFCIFWSLEI